MFSHRCLFNCVFRVAVSTPLFFQIVYRTLALKFKSFSFSSELELLAMSATAAPLVEDAAAASRPQLPEDLLEKIVLESGWCVFFSVWCAVSKTFTAEWLLQRRLGMVVVPDRADDHGTDQPRGRGG